MRDFQRSKVYGAEEALNPKQMGPHLARMDLVMGYIHEIVRRTIWMPWPQVIVVGDGRGCQNASAEIGFAGEVAELRLPLWARTPVTITHELAHCVADPRFADHGPEFCGIHLVLLGSVHLPGQMALRAQYDAKGVEYAKAGSTSLLVRTPAVLGRMPTIERKTQTTKAAKRRAED